MSELIERKLDDIGCKFISGFGFKSSDYTDKGIPLIKIGNIQNRVVSVDSKGTFVSENIINNKIRSVFLSNRDVLIAMTGQGSVGRVGRLKLNKNEKALLNQRVGKFVCDEKNLNIDYLYYILTSDIYQDYLFNTGAGSGQPNLSPTLILQTEIPWFKYEIQTAIASILSSLDDKIDLLHRQNQTLEKMAETLFRQWFVEEAKEEWEESTLFNAIELIGGGTPKTTVSEYWNGDINWLSGGDIANNHKNIIISSEKSITEEGLKNSSAKLLPKFSTVISARGTVGKYCILSEPMAFSQSNYGIKPKFKDCYFFTYLLINYSVEELQSAAYGSVFDTITTNTFKGLFIQIPLETEIQEFENLNKPYFQRILNNQNQIRILSTLRDTLLPKLMSGEVRVEIN
jgi:type I restriction enzyme, S subunit